MVNCGYGEEVISFAKANPNLKIKAYWDKKEAAETESPLPNLSFHRIHDKKFLQDMAACKGLISTAGFESICEAMYLGKPVMVIPVAGQYEQACNALDVEAAGAGIVSENFDFGKFNQAITSINPNPAKIQNWNEKWSELFRQLVELPNTSESSFPDFMDQAMASLHQPA
jgi:uncharacterized protein (TIGR00661 family)